MLEIPGEVEAAHRKEAAPLFKEVTMSAWWYGLSAAPPFPPTAEAAWPLNESSQPSHARVALS